MEYIKIAKKIKDEGYTVALVGGAVRDLYLGRQPKDFDLATNATPKELRTIFPQAKMVGNHFPVVIVDGVEVATFRTEEGIKGRKDAKVVKMVSNIEDDLARRDFTINAMALVVDHDDSLNLVDPFNGLQDIEWRMIRFVGDAEKRIKEDPVRLLRAVRFAAQLGFQLDGGTENAICWMSSEIESLSKERIRMEFEKIILSRDPVKAMKLLYENDVLKFFLPELEKTIGCDQNNHHSETVFKHLILALEYARKMRVKDKLAFRLAALFHDIGKPQTKEWDFEKRDWTFHGHEGQSSKMAYVIMKRLKFDKETITKVCTLIRNHMFHFTEDTNISRIKNLMVRMNDKGLDIRDLMRLRICDRRANLAKQHKAKITKSFKNTLKSIRKIEKENAALKITDLAINGTDLIEMGYKPGPFFSKVLNHLLEKVLAEELLNERESLRIAVLAFEKTWKE